MGRFADRRHRGLKAKHESSLSSKSKENKSVKKKNGYQKTSIQKKSLIIDDEPPKRDIVKFLRRSQLMQLSQWSKWPSAKKK